MLLQVVKKFGLGEMRNRHFANGLGLTKYVDHPFRRQYQGQPGTYELTMA